jgi:hypothetical protein
MAKSLRSMVVFMDETDGQERYIRLFLLFSAKVERWMKMVIAILLGLLIVFQLALQFPNLRYFLTRVDRLEGIPYVNGTAVIP